MRNFLLILIVIAAVMVANYLVLADWFNPTANPPNDNVAAPLNVGPGRQTKAGDITVNNLKATSVTLGEDTRFAWPGGGGGVSCGWEGLLCHCNDDTNGTEGYVVIGSNCLGGVFAGVRVVKFSVSIGSAACPKETPPACTAGYTRR